MYFVIGLSLMLPVAIACLTFRPQTQIQNVAGLCSRGTNQILEARSNIARSLIGFCIKALFSTFYEFYNLGGRIGILPISKLAFKHSSSVIACRWGELSDSIECSGIMLSLFVRISKDYGEFFLFIYFYFYFSIYQLWALWFHIWNHGSETILQWSILREEHSFLSLNI